MHFLFSGHFLVRQEWLWAVFQEGATLEQLNAARLIQHMQSTDQTLPFHIAWGTGISTLVELRITPTFIQCTQRTDIFYDNGSFPFSFRIFFLLLKFQTSSIFHISEKSLFIHSFKPNFSRRKRFQNFEKQLNNNFTWGSDSNRKFCPVLIVAFLFVTVPIIAGIAGRIWLISMHFNSF